MAQRLFSFIGLLILTVLIILAVLFMGLFYDQLGIITMPEAVKAALTWHPQPVTVRVESQPVGTAVWSNPLDELPVWTAEALPTLSPTPVPTETPWPTPTPIPPLDPFVYQTEVMLRLKDVAAALEHWLDLNKELANNWALLDDPAWQATMYTVLGKIQTSAQALGEVTPAPVEYASIQALLEQTGIEAQALSDHYAQAMWTQDKAQFTAAGDSFTRMKTYLAEAVAAMLDAGWKIE